MRFNLTPQKNLLFIGSAVAFAAALVLYIFCVDPGASLWDCPEYITSARRLEVGHPPGNSTWMLMANFVSGFVSDPSKVALAVNLTSCFAMALGVMLLYQTIFFFLGATVFRSATRGASVANAVASLCGSLVFAWSDSTIFSAVEAEVYALSLLSTAFMVWLMLKWAIAYRHRDSRPGYIILLGYIAGLSFGIHELALLTFTTLFLIYTFTVNRGPSPSRSWLAVALSFCVIGFLLLFWIPGVVSMAGEAELLAVNKLGLRYNSGAVIFIVVLFLVLLCLPFVAYRLRLPKVGLACWVFFFFTAGCATYLIIPVRGSANPPMNQGNPANPFSFRSYLTREQYGSKPLFYGRTPYSSQVYEEIIDSSGKASYAAYVRKKKHAKFAPFTLGTEIPDRYGFLTAEDSIANAGVKEKGRGYVKYGYNYDYVYQPELNMWFPRITGSSPTDIDNYRAWAGMDTTSMVLVEVSGAVDSLGNFVGLYPSGDTSGKREKEKKYRPTYLQQLQYMLGYQMGYMYFRYLLWNFSGRQNNIPSTGEIDHGNFITGIAPVDNLMLGDQNLMPKEIGRDNPGHNRYFMLPLLFGLFGAVGMSSFGRNGRRATTIVLSLFLMTGLAIVFYLNQTPAEPRERDYSFLGSFYAFSIWIGFGAAILMRFAYRLSKTRRLGNSGFGRKAVVTSGALICLGLPALVLGQTYDDHNRSGRASAEEVAVNFLNSLDTDAIVVIEGDNKYFPIVYAQEVLGVRRDVTIILQSYFFSAWYLSQLPRPGEESLPVPMTMPPGDLLYESYPFVRIGPAGSTGNASEVLEALYSGGNRAEIPRLSAETLIFDSPEGSVSLNLRELNDGKSLLSRDKLALIDIIVSNARSAKPRPIYWQADIHAPVYGKLAKYSLPGLYARKWAGNVDEGRLRAVDVENVATFRKLFDGKGRETNFYAEPYVANSLFFLRRDALTLSRRLVDNGDCADGREVLLTALKQWPYHLIPPKRIRTGDGNTEELDFVIDILETIRRQNPSDKEVGQLAEELGRFKERRRLEYKKYYDSLPSWRRGTVSYQTFEAAGVLR